MRVTITTVLLLLVASHGEGAEAPKKSAVDEVLATLDEKDAAVQAYSLVVESTMNMSSPDFSQESFTTNTIMWKRSGDTVMMRMESKSKTEMTMDGTTTKTESELLMVVDGIYAWTETEMAPGMKMISKTDASRIDQDSPSKVLGALTLNYDAKLREDETVDGHDCVVIELNDKSGESSMSQMVYYFTKEHGLLMKSVGYDADGKVTMTREMKDVEIDPKLEDSLFTYEPPEGAQVMDMTEKKK